MMTSTQLQSRITEDILIGELVEKYPEAVETLLSYGVHCIGCHVSPYESLGDGFRGHGLGEAEIQEALQKLNEVIVPNITTAETPAAEITVSFTSLAAQKIQEACSRQNKKALRIAVEKGGCSGYGYLFTLLDAPKEGDLVFGREQGVTVFIDKNSIPRMNGAVIDYHDALTGAGFKVKNPQATGSCGCGNSFKA